MTRRMRMVLMVAGALALAALMVALRSTRKAAPQVVLDAVPADTFAVVVLDLARLRGSPLFASLGKLRASFGEVGRVQAACGFDPLARADEVALALPLEQSGEFGLAARGGWSSEELVSCGRKMGEARGDKPIVDADPERQGFTRITSSLRLTRGASIAVHDSGLVVLGEGVWMTRMLDAWTGSGPRLTTATRHAELLAALGGEGRLLVATVLLPTSLRQRLLGEMERESQDAGAQAAMRGVLGVEAAGLALATRGENVELAVELRCDGTAACAEVRRLADKKRDAWARDLRLRLVGLGAVVDATRFEGEGTRLAARASLPAAEVAQLIDRLMALRDSPDVPPRAMPLPSSAPPSPTPDEVLPARRGRQ